MASNRWQDIYLHLKEKGFEAYAPMVKDGECTSPYVVIKNDGGNEHESVKKVSVDLYSIMCYVPKLSYSTLETFVLSVEEAMAELSPMIKTYGRKTSSYYDDAYKAHMVSVTYKNYKKMF